MTSGSGSQGVQRRRSTKVLCGFLTLLMLGVWGVAGTTPTPASAATPAGRAHEPGAERVDGHGQPYLHLERRLRCQLLPGDLPEHDRHWHHHDHQLHELVLVAHRAADRVGHLVGPRQQRHRRRERLGDLHKGPGCGSDVVVPRADGHLPRTNANLHLDGRGGDEELHAQGLVGLQLPVGQRRERQAAHQHLPDPSHLLHPHRRSVGRPVLLRAGLPARRRAASTRRPRACARTRSCGARPATT